MSTFSRQDQLLGCRALKKAGGRIFAEAASSCVVYGMPRTIIEVGLADGKAPLDGLARLLVENCELPALAIPRR